MNELSRPVIEPRGYPDDFYKSVAERYEQLWLRTNRIAPVIADECAVPLSTVHRWISIARRKGYLGPRKAAEERPPRHHCPLCDHGA